MIRPSSSITKSNSGMKAGLLLYSLSTKCSWHPGLYTFQNASLISISTSCQSLGSSTLIIIISDDF
ncbi:MAG: hypothetical protein J6Z32_04960 [Bacteroidales bacterium]|nr:hypothetical protein [Bacteroidales bacterium]